MPDELHIRAMLDTVEKMHAICTSELTPTSSLKLSRLIGRAGEQASSAGYHIPPIAYVGDAVRVVMPDKTLVSPPHHHPGGLPVLPQPYWPSDMSPDQQRMFLEFVVVALDEWKYALLAKLPAAPPPAEDSGPARSNDATVITTPVVVESVISKPAPATPPSTARGRSIPMSKKDMAMRLGTTKHKLPLILKDHDLKMEGNRQLWSVSFEHMDPNMRAKLNIIPKPTK